MYLIWIWNLENYFDDIIFYDDLKKKKKEKHDRMNNSKITKFDNLRQ